MPENSGSRSRRCGWLVIFVFITNGALLQSCSLVVPADQVQCDADEDCAIRGFERAFCQGQLCTPIPVDPIWGCLGSVPEPMPMPGESHHVEMRFVDVITERPPQNVRARLCAQADINCAAPVIDDVPIDEEGRLEFDVDSGFQGYLELSSDTTIPALVPFGPVVADIPLGVAVHLVPPFVASSLANAVGFEFSMDKGMMLLLLAGCDGLGHPGLSFTTSSGETAYIYDITPDPEAEQSDANGQGLVYNADPGFVTLSSVRFGAGEFVSQKRSLVRAGSVTYVQLSPTTPI